MIWACHPCPAPFMTATPDSFDRLIQSIDRIDTIRSQSAQVEQALGSAERDKVLVDKLIATYREQGIELDPAMVAKAVAQTLPTRALAIPAPAHPIAHRLARAWLSRDRWIKPVGIGTSLAALALVVVLGAGMVNNRLDAARLAEAAAQTMNVQRQADRALASADALDVSIPVQSDLVARARAQIQQANTDLQQAKTLADSNTDASGLHEPIERLNTKATQALAAASSDITLALQLPALARQIAHARELAASPSGWPQLDEVLAQRLAHAQGLLSDPQGVSGLPVVVAELNTLATAGRSRAALREAAKTVPPDGAEQAASLVSAGETALLRGQATAANQALEQLRDLSRLGAASYTLRITNDPNERTGVWRHHSSSPNARNYYIVVDAVDAAGNPVQVPVINEEDGSRHSVSRFAVRVPERVYNQVRDDKLDNGLVDNNQFATKKSGTLQTQYAFDVDGGMITNW